MRHIALALARHIAGVIQQSPDARREASRLISQAHAMLVRIEQEVNPVEPGSSVEQFPPEVVGKLCRQVVQTRQAAGETTKAREKLRGQRPGFYEADGRTYRLTYVPGAERVDSAKLVDRAQEMALDLGREFVVPRTVATPRLIVTDVTTD